MDATEKRLVNGEWIETPVYYLKPNDMVALIDRLQVLFGKPSQITEERSLGVSIDAGVDADVLREFIEATRGLGGSSSMWTSPLPRTRRLDD